MAALTDSTGLDRRVTQSRDEDAFFELAAQGSHGDTRPGATSEPDARVGAAALPRRRSPDHASGGGHRRAREPRRRDDGRQPRDPRTRLGWPRAARRAWLVAPVGAASLAAVAAASFAAHGAGDSPARSPAPVAASAPVVVPGPEDVVAPVLAGASLRAARRRGGVAVAGRVGDGGSGVRRVQLLVDGEPVAGAAGRCRPRCRASLRFALTARLAGGPHGVALVAADAAGNRALLWQRLLAGGERPAEAGRLTVGVVAGGRSRSIAWRAGPPTQLSGRLTGARGGPLAAARIELLALARTASATPRRVAVVRTDAAGRWRAVGLPVADGSHSYVARELDDSGRVGAVSPPATLVVRARLTALRRRLPGGVLLLAGRVAAASGQRLEVLAARRIAGRWRAVASARVDRSAGRYALRVRGGSRWPLAVFVAPSPAWPYAPAGRRAEPARRR